MRKSVKYKYSDNLLNKQKKSMKIGISERKMIYLQ